MGEAMIHGKRLIGGHKMLCDCGSDHGGHGLPAILFRHINPSPAARFELFKGFLEPGGRAHLACVPCAAVTITNRIQGRHDGTGQLARFV